MVAKARPLAAAPTYSRRVDRSRTGAAASVLSVALVTLAVFGLREIAPVVSVGVVYLLPVLLLSVRWGLRYGLATALLGAAAFNFFHLPPTGRFTIASSENWVALAVFLVVAVVVSRLADAGRARAVEAEDRRREADALAGLAQALLESATLEEARAVLAARLSEAFGLDSASVELRSVSGDARTVDLALTSEGRRMGTLLVPRSTPPAVLESLRGVAPSLAALLAVARRREELAAEVVETRALRRSDVVKTALLRSVSHDLRSPLTAIVASAEALEGEDPDARELAEGIAQEGRRLAHLVDDLLDLSRLEGGSAAPRSLPCALDEVLEAAVASLPTDAPVDLQVEGELPMLQADPAQLERAFANLLDNARVHGGGGTIVLRARKTGHRIRVRVSDQGPGIPPGALERVFEPFHQEDGASGGAGLGLAIARGFVEANGGTLRAESLPGQGASFVAELPIRVRPRTEAAST
jgi:two-component system, OmpR family, sensor histidine kinase KdpD